MHTKDDRAHGDDSTNCLISFSFADPPDATFTYNGLGDRLTQTVNGQETDYTLDLAAGLTQVLSDGAHHYLYGNMRLAQVPTSSPSSYEFFLPDALGSVRQMIDESGELTLSQAYQPYGETLNSYGSGVSPYGFAGEYTDSQTGLQYLRARYYAPGVGRFITKDAWTGDAVRPMSYNGWVYGFANPVRYIDPSGNIPCELLPPIDQAGCEEGAGGSSSGPQPPLPPMSLPYCTPRLLAAGEPCMPGPCPGGLGTGGEWPPIADIPARVTQETVDAFLTLREQLGPNRVVADGRLKDEVLIALIIQEFRNYRGLPKTYGESLEAVSNQYHNHSYLYGCKGSCDTIAEQLNWMQDIQAFRTSLDILTDWETFLNDATSAKNTQYQYGAKFESWTWGNYLPGSPLDKYARGLISKADWWHGKGYTGEPYVDIVKDEDRYVIFTIPQNLACNSREGGSCKGW